MVHIIDDEVKFMKEITLDDVKRIHDHFGTRDATGKVHCSMCPFGQKLGSYHFNCSVEKILKKIATGNDDK
jgi:hypothetical protein